MFSSGPPFPTLTSTEDAKRPAIAHDPRSIVASRMLALAKRRNGDQTPTHDVAAVFKEGERAPVAGADAA
jgi:hypothetical protein